MQFFKKRERKIILILTATAISAFILNFLFLPVLGNLSNLNRQIGLEKKRVVKYARLLKNKDQIMDLYQKSPIFSNEPEGNDDDLVSVLARIENLAKSANLTITEVRPESGNNSILLKAEADMEGYFRFLYAVENFLPNLTLNKFTLLTRPGAEKIQGTFSLSINSLLK